MKNFILFVLLVISFIPGIVGQEIPDVIDPYSPTATDFLFLDLNKYLLQGEHEYRSGNYEAAARQYLSALRYDINDAQSLYKLARCYALLDRDSLAAQILLEAVSAGFSDYLDIEQNPDFDQVRESSVFRDSMVKIRREDIYKQGPVDTTLQIVAPALYPCLVQYPNSGRPSEPVPLVVGLHGYGGSPTGFLRLFQRYQDRPFIYATLQAPYPMNTENNEGFSWSSMDNPDQDYRQLQITQAAEQVVRAIRHLKRVYPVSNVTLVGFSQGAMLSLVTAIRYVEDVQSAVAFGGWLNLDELSPEEFTSLKKPRLLLVHGREDRVIDFKKAESAEQTLRNQGYEVSLMLFSGGHSIPPPKLNQAFEWICKEP